MIPQTPLISSMGPRALLTPLLLRGVGSQLTTEALFSNVLLLRIQGVVTRSLKLFLFLVEVVPSSEDPKDLLWVL